MIQFITHHNERYGYLDSVRLALAGGCRWVQLRVKGATADELRPMALETQRLCREAGATFIIDDQVMLVREIGADGVHLGQKDMPIAEARQLLGPDCIIGGTANTADEVMRHWRDGADYVGCGPYRYTTTKQGLAPILGLEGYRQIVARMRQECLAARRPLPNWEAPGPDTAWMMPIVAIGGITADDIPALMQTGVTGIALSGAVLNAADPVEEMRKLSVM